MSELCIELYICLKTMQLKILRSCSVVYQCSSLMLSNRHEMLICIIQSINVASMLFKQPD